MRVLLVEDDKRIAEFVRKGLEQAGYAVDWAEDGESGLERLTSGSYAAAVIDVMLPLLDGLGVLERLRGRGFSTPVLILSAKRSLEDRLAGLQTGADDYLVKPFAFAELLERIRALIRRSSGVVEPTSLSVRGLRLDLLRHKLSWGGREIPLLPREFALLEYLLRNAGYVVSKTMILQQVWGYDFDPGTNVVEANICRLRAKLKQVLTEELIRTVRGVGYTIDRS